MFHWPRHYGLGIENQEVSHRLQLCSGPFADLTVFGALRISQPLVSKSSFWPFSSVLHFVAIETSLK